MQKQAHADEVWSARFDSTGNRVVTASRDHSARVLEVDPVTMAFSEVATIKHDEDDRLSEGTAFMAMSVAMDRDHGRLFVGSADATIRIWDLENGNEVDQATGTGLNSSFALSSDGSMLLTGSSSTEDKAILWQIDPTGKQNPRVLWRIKQPNHTVTAFAISADNTMFFTGDRNGLGYLWSVETGQPLGERIEDVDGYRINAACFSADSRQLLHQLLRLAHTTGAPHHLPFPEDEQGWNAADTVSLGDRRVLVHVDLHHSGQRPHLRCHLLEDGGLVAARPAPVGIEIDQYRRIPVDELLEVVHAPALLLHRITGLLPARDPALQMLNSEAFRPEMLHGLSAASTRTAIQQDGHLGIKLAERLFVIVTGPVDIDASGKVSGAVLARGPDVDEPRLALIDRSLERRRFQVGDELDGGCAATRGSGLLFRCLPATHG